MPDCQYAPCSNSLEGKRPDARFCSDQCRYDDWDAKHPRIPTASRATDTTTIAEVTADQEVHARAESLAVRQAILQAAAANPDGTVFADDVDVPESFRRYVPGQMNGLRNSRCLTKTSEYRNSRRGPRHGSGSWVYSITKKGREQLVGRGVGTNEGSVRSVPDHSCGVLADTASAPSSESEPASLFPDDTGKAAPLNPLADAEAA